MESNQCREPWNKGKLVGQKPPLKPKDIWAIRIHLQNGGRIRDLAMFNLAIDSKLRGCDLVNLRVRDALLDPRQLWQNGSASDTRSNTDASTQAITDGPGVPRGAGRHPCSAWRVCAAVADSTAGRYAPPCGRVTPIAPEPE